jgi:NAD(P)-dependent dehydrogenase (short-subunit alcohol dehydrogenase family)
MEKRVIVITGASAGVGRATARAFAKPGRCIALLARGESGLDAAKREVEEAGAQALAIPTDVSDYAQVDSAAQQVVAEWGAIDTWVNDAMVTVFSPVWDLRPDELKHATEVTYLGAAYGTMVALKHMRPRNHGAIVQVGSALSYRAIPLQAAYCASKFALRGFTDALRCELLHERSRIHVTCVHLSAFNTPQFDWARDHLQESPQPLPPIFDPELAARAIVWASEHRRREVFVGFPAVKAVVGNRIAPGLMDRLMARQAWSGQFSGQPKAIDRKSNLMVPRDEHRDAGARGRFDRRASKRSWQLEFTMHRRAILTVLGVAAFGGLFAAMKAKRRSMPQPA